MLSLPFITPMVASPCREPFDHTNWLSEINHTLEGAGWPDGTVCWTIFLPSL
jgi:hypothetical protein